MPTFGLDRLSRRRSDLRYLSVCALLAFAGDAMGEEYRLEVGDVIEVSIAGMPEMRQRLPIQLDGSISFPRLGRLAVAGTTIAETEHSIQAALSSQLFHQKLADGRESLVSVEPNDVAAIIIEYRPVYVDGDVAKPGEQPYRPLMTVRQAVSVAGGYDVLRAGTKPPMVEIADARGDQDSVMADLAKEAANIGRIRRELGDKSAALTPPVIASNLSRQTVQDIQKSQLDLLEINQADYQRERSYLKRGSEQLGAQSEVLTRQQKDEEQGLKVDTEELNRLAELLGRGAVISQRVTDARRAALLSSTRSLQATAQLMQATRQREETARQLERLDDQRRMRLLAELSDRTTRLQQLQSRSQALDLKVAGFGARMTGDTAARRVPDIHVIRHTPDGQERLAATEEFALRPGDIVDIALRAKPESAAVSSSGGESLPEGRLAQGGGVR